MKSIILVFGVVFLLKLFVTYEMKGYTINSGIFCFIA